MYSLYIFEDSFSCQDFFISKSFVFCAPVKSIPPFSFSSNDM